MLDQTTKPDFETALQSVKLKLQEGKFLHPAFPVSDERITKAIEFAYALCDTDELTRYEASKKLTLTIDSYSVFMNEFFTMLNSVEAHTLPDDMNAYYNTLHELLKLQKNFNEVIAGQPTMEVIMQRSHEFLEESKVLMPKEHESLNLKFSKIKKISNGVESVLMQVIERVKAIRQIVFTLTTMRYVIDDICEDAKNMADAYKGVSFTRLLAMKNQETALVAQRTYLVMTSSLIETMSTAFKSYEAICSNQALAKELLDIHHKHLVMANAACFC